MTVTTPTAQSRVSIAGLVFGAREDDSGVEWSLASVDGWGSPASTLKVVQKPRSNGGWAGDSFLAPRTLAIVGRVRAPSTAALDDALNRLYSAVALPAVPLTVHQYGIDRTMMVRRSDEVIVQHHGMHAHWSIQVVALDPRKLGAELSGTTGLPLVTGGLTVPFTIPFIIDSTVVSGQVSLFNPGNTAGPVRIRINGPVVAPRITHNPSGKTWAASLTLGTGEWLDVDMEARTVLAQGTSSRTPWVTDRGWQEFLPGDNTWAFTAATNEPAASITVWATPAWL